MGLVMKRAGAAVPSANRITLLRDSQGSGVADQLSVLLEGMNSPFGMALVDTDLYVANTDAVLRFPYTPGQHRRTPAVREGVLQQQCRRTRHALGARRRLVDGGQRAR